MFIAHQSLIHAGRESSKGNECLDLFPEQLTHISIHAYVQIKYTEEMGVVNDEELRKWTNPTTVFVKLNESMNEKSK